MRLSILRWLLKDSPIPASISAAYHALRSFKNGGHTIFKSTVPSIPFWDATHERCLARLEKTMLELGESIG